MTMTFRGEDRSAEPETRPTGLHGAVATARQSECVTGDPTLWRYPQPDHGRSGTIAVIHSMLVSTRAVVSALACGQFGPVLSVETSTGAAPGGVVK